MAWSRIQIGLRARAVAALALVLCTVWPRAASAQAPVPPIAVDLYYTVSFPVNTDFWWMPDLTDFSAVRGVRLEGDSLAEATITPSREVSRITPFMPGGMMFDPNGRLLVACGRNAVVQVEPGTGEALALPACQLPGQDLGDPPRMLDLAADPASDRAWAVIAGPSSAAVSVQPEFGPGPMFALQGDDRSLTDLAFTSIVDNGQPLQRVFYAAEATPGGTGAPSRSYGFINLRTGQTNRLQANIPAARALAHDPFTGHLMMAGSRFIAQVDCTLITPRIIATLDLASVVIDGASLDLVDATCDGRGRIFAVSSDGRLVAIDYSRLPGVSATQAQARINDSGNVVRVFQIEEPPVDADRSAYAAIRGLAPLSGPGRPKQQRCIWDNGEADLVSGQLSQVNPDQGQPETADDFYLCPGYIYTIDSITATLATDSPFPNKARLEIYEDCNGMPGALITRIDTLDLTDKQLMIDDLRVYTARFYLGGLCIDGSDGRGGGRTIWISVRGVGLGIGPEQWFWTTAGESVVRGRPGVFRSSAAGYPDWTLIEGFGCGCSDFSFAVHGDRCKVLIDGGEPDIWASPPGSLSQIASETDTARTADDLVSPPSDGPPLTVCYLRAYMYSNCTPVRGRFELYTDACHKPGSDPGHPIDTSAFARVTDTGYTVNINGVGLTVYMVESYGLTWTLMPGRNYWIAPVGDTTFAQSKRSYAAFGVRCRETCPIEFSPAQAAGRGVDPTSTTLRWRTVSDQSGTARGLALMVGIEEAHEDPSAGGAGGPAPACPADTDRSGEVTVQDLFTFLQAWFLGCP